MWGVFTDPDDGLRVCIDLGRIINVAELPDGTTGLLMETNSKDLSIHVKESFDEVMRMVAANEVQV